MTSVLGKRRNPELEAVRYSAKPPLANESHIDELIRKTGDIHVSFLFSPEGKRVRNELCLTLSSTRHTPIYSGWEDLGHHLGLDPRVVTFSGLGTLREDPTYYIVRAYADKERGTIANLIEALRSIKRCDVITKNYDLFIELGDQIRRKYRAPEESGYLSLSEGTAESSNESSEDDIQQSIIKYPYSLPSVPSILTVQSTEPPERCTQINIQVQHPKQEEQLVRSTPNNIKTEGTTPRAKYGITVMLTFTSDGYEYAKEVAKILRENRDGQPRIGVLILQEQLAALTQDDQQFIAGAFQQVNYVIPIITRQYLKRIIDVENNEADATCVDDKYVRYIYVLMKTHYIKNGCRNLKCSCIIPDDFLHPFLSHPIQKIEPLFNVWYRLSHTEKLSQTLLKTTLVKRKLTNC